MNREEMRKQVKRLREKRANREQTTPAPAPKPAEVKKGVVKVSSYSTKKNSLNQVKSAENSDNKQVLRRKHIEIQREAQRRSGRGCGGCKRRIGQ